jgi:hypothetical protein
MATVVGDGFAYFLDAAGKPQTWLARTPLTFRGVAIRSLQAEERFDLRRWSSRQGIAYSVSVESGVIHSTLPGGAVYQTKK